MATAAPAAPPPSTPSSAPSAPSGIPAELSEFLKARKGPEVEQDLRSPVEKLHEEAEKPKRKVAPIPPGIKKAAPEGSEAEVEADAILELEGKKYNQQQVKTFVGQAKAARQAVAAVKAWQKHAADLKAQLAQLQGGRPQQAPHNAPTGQEGAPKGFLESLGDKAKVFERFYADEQLGPRAAVEYYLEQYDGYQSERLKSLEARFEQTRQEAIEAVLGQLEPVLGPVVQQHEQAQVNEMAVNLFVGMADKKDSRGTMLYPALADSEAASQIAALWADLARQNPGLARTERGFRLAYMEWQDANPSWQAPDSDDYGSDQQIEEVYEPPPISRAAAVTTGARSGFAGQRELGPADELLRRLAGSGNSQKSRLGFNP